MHMNGFWGFLPVEIFFLGLIIIHFLLELK